jgi:formylglycine-generating enzyme
MRLNSINRKRCHAAHLGLSFLLVAITADARAVTINWTSIGNPSNAPDTTVMGDGTSGYGAVGYGYKISTYDIINSQYVDFLNSKDPNGLNTLGLYDTHMSDVASYGGISFTSGGPTGDKYGIVAGQDNMPVNWVTWYSCIRFANWLNNGQGNSDTESGSYTLWGGTPTPTNASTITRNQGASVFLPSENEWYKAAYYNPAKSSYFQYPTSSNTAPTATAPPGLKNSANFNNSVGHLTAVGAYSSSSSPYHTFDQGGDLYQWDEGVAAGSTRVIRGGAFSLIAAGLLDSSRGNAAPTTKGAIIGFRIASACSFLPGDFNRDGHVNAADVSAMMAALADLHGYETHQGLSDAQLLTAGDINGDGKLTDGDLQSLLNLLKASSGSSNPVPEPDTFVLAVVAFSMLWWRFRFNVGQSQRRLVPVAVPSTR